MYTIKISIRNFVNPLKAVSPLLNIGQVSKSMVDTSVGNGLVLDREPVLIIVAIYRYTFVRPSRDSFPRRRNGEKYRFTFQPWSINYFRDPCNNVAFLFSLGQFLAENVPRI